MGGLGLGLIWSWLGLVWSGMGWSRLGRVGLDLIKSDSRSDLVKVRYGRMHGVRGIELLRGACWR